MQDDGHARGRQLVEHEVALGRAVEHELEPELLLRAAARSRCPARGCAVTSSGTSPSSTFDERLAAQVAVGPLARRPRPSCASRRIPARRPAPRAAAPAASARVPGDLPSLVRARSAPSVAATIASGTITASSTVSPRVFTIIVWPEIRRPAPWPGVDRRDAEAAHPLDQRARARCRRRSRAARAGSARERSSWSWSCGWFSAPGEPDDRVRVDRARRDDLGARASACRRGRCHGRGRPDRGDLPVAARGRRRPRSAGRPSCGRLRRGRRCPARAARAASAKRGEHDRRSGSHRLAPPRRRAGSAAPCAAGPRRSRPRHQAVLSVVAVEHLHALDPGLQHVRVDRERIAGEHDEVGVLAASRLPTAVPGRACAPASVSASSAFSRDMPARTASAAERRNSRESVM